jgi:hypothetical protein
MSDQCLVFEGSFVEIKRIETELKYNGINPIIINKRESALLSGFGFNPHEKIKIYVFKDQLKNAKDILKELNIKFVS